MKINYWSNPALGMIPFLVYSLASNYLSYNWSLFIAFLCGLFFLLNTRSFIRRHTFPILILFGVISFGLSLLLAISPIFDNREEYELLLPEIFLLLLMYILYNRKFRFIRFALQFGKKRLGFSLKPYLYECFFLYNYLHFCLFGFILVSALHLFVLDSFHSLEWSISIVIKLRIILILMLIVLGYIRLYFLISRLNKETWLPILDEHSRVVGKIARSVSYQFKERYLHPRIRILVFHKDMVFLSSREQYLMIDVNKLDTPLQRDLAYKQEKSELVIDLLREFGLPFNNMPNDLTHYMYEKAPIRRDVYLFALQIDSKDKLGSLGCRGKFWTKQQIIDNLGKNVFSNCFENEFEFLRDTVFPLYNNMNEVKI